MKTAQAARHWHWPGKEHAMADIRHRVGIAAPQARVDEAVATREGLSGWRTREVDGYPSVGGTLEFYFGQPEPGAVMEVIALTPAWHVRWRCVQGLMSGSARG